MSQWNVRVHILDIDVGSHAKIGMAKGNEVTVPIEPHATIHMLKQRVAMIVGAHMSWQTLSLPGSDAPLDDLTKLQDVEGLGDESTINLTAVAPKSQEEDVGELEEDTEAMAVEDVEPPGLPGPDAMNAELTEEQEDFRNKCNGEAAEALEDGDKATALKKYTEAIMVGNSSAMLLAKRGELLLKMRRPKAAVLDADAALAKNPDSAKAYRLRAKSHRFLSMWQEAVADFSSCQKIDYDPDLKEMHDFCTHRKKWHAKKAAQEAAKADGAAD